MAPSAKLASKVRLSDGGAPVHVSAGTGSFCFSGDASSCKLGLHDLRSGDAIIHHDIGSNVPTVTSTAHDSSKCAFGTTSGALFVWDVQFPTLLESFVPTTPTGEDVPVNPGARITCVEWHPRGHVLASGTADGTIAVWDMVLGTPVSVIPEAHAGGVKGLAWTAHGRVLASVGEDGSLKVWNARHCEVEAMIDGTGDASMWHKGGVTCVDTIADMSRVAISGGDDGSVFLSVLKPGEKNDECGVFEKPRAHDNSSVNAVRIAGVESIKPMRCASGADDGSLQLFDMDRRMPMGAFKHEGERGVRQVEFNYSGDVLFSAAGGTVKAWDARVVAEEAAEVTFGEKKGAPVTSFAVGNVGASVVTGAEDGMLRMYDMRYPAGTVPIIPAVGLPAGAVGT